MPHIHVTYCREHTPNKVVLGASAEPIQAYGHDIYNGESLSETHTDIGSVQIDNETSLNLAYLESTYQSLFT